MSLTPQQQYELLYAMVHEALRLANKFGLNEQPLCDLLQSLSSNEGEKHSLADMGTMLHPDSSDSKDKDLVTKFNERYLQKKQLFNQALVEIFGTSKSENNLQTSIKILDSPKKFRKSKSNSTALEELKAEAKKKLRYWIKAQFGVTRSELADVRTIFCGRIGEKNNEENNFIKLLIALSVTLSKQNTPKNHKYYGIYINSLYQLIKILNEMNHSSLVEAYLSFFKAHNERNESIIECFFAVENNRSFCRRQTLLVKILESLITNDLECTRIRDECVQQMGTHLTKESNTITMDDSFYPMFLENVLSLATRFSYILNIAKQQIANRMKYTMNPKASEDIFLKSAFLLCFLSPLLKDIVEKAKSSGIVDEILVYEQFHRDLTLFFNIVLGLKSSNYARELQQTGRLPQFLIELALNDETKECVNKHFSAMNECELMVSRQKLPRPNPNLDDWHDTTVRLASCDLPAESRQPSTESRTNRRKSDNPSFKSIGRKKGGFLIRTYSKPSLPTVTSKSSDSGSPENKSMLFFRPSLSLAQTNPWNSYFNDLFLFDQEKAIKLVLVLTQSTHEVQPYWGICVLNELTDRHREIASTLVKNLNEGELLSVFEVLFRNSNQWGQKKTLLSVLIQEVLARDDYVTFKQGLWQRFTSLQKSDVISDKKIRDSGILGALQNKFTNMLSDILSINQFPELLQHIVQLGYLDLIRRFPQSAMEERADTLLHFVLLRFIEPVVQEQAMCQSNQHEASWYLDRILPALFSLTSICQTNKKIEQAILFAFVINNKDVIAKLLTQFDGQVRNMTTQVILDDTVQLPVLNATQCNAQLSELLIRAGILDVQFKPDGCISNTEKKTASCLTLFPALSEGADSECSEVDRPKF